MKDEDAKNFEIYGIDTSGRLKRILQRQIDIWPHKLAKEINSDQWPVPRYKRPTPTGKKWKHYK